MKYTVLMVSGFSIGWLLGEYLPKEWIIFFGIIILFLGGILLGMLIENTRISAIFRKGPP